MLQDILPVESIRFADRFDDWRDAVRAACQPLLERGAIEPAYIDAIIENVEKIGPYIVIAPDVAIPHARPEAGAKAIAMSLLKVSEPVAFSDDPEHQARLLFAFSATDSHSHQRALKQLAHWIMDEAKFAELQAATSPEVIAALIASLGD
ncbi:hypothetical protein JHS3_10420 [Jeongeupia sp. HS-3]|uniref:PTS sugar transporter subunit IIA n=1 Tax=Jeongeupia sp. HS-3 TaxID=1009682 RepID=UPI0018A65C63|nr:PTS sugar transporter subunit IIA [Jeongeupia sp. HS-3]BCL75306.1 hypothetical protein JHS3_10420 [Jeongeupia sp. HS-3]